MKLSTLGFLVIICGLPIGQAAVELSRGERPQALEIIGPLEERRLRAFEDDLHDASVITRELVPQLQDALARGLRRGNEKALFGTDDWLFLAEDVDFVTGPGLLETGVGGGRALETIITFRDRLAEREIQLLVVPVPTKAVVESHRFVAGLDRADNRDAEAFRSRLVDAGINVLDLRALYRELRTSQPDLYLRHDTHWRPETMKFVAERIATEARRLLEQEPREQRYMSMNRTLTGAGDTLAMLSLPEPERVAPSEVIDIETIADSQTGESWASDRGSDVLLLGDSFTRIFSDDRLGHGSGAGLAEHVSRTLGRPIDVIAMAGGGALGPREALALRAEGLRKKRLIIWEFTERELVSGDARWEWVDLPEGGPIEEPAAQPEETAGDVARVAAEIVAISEIGPDFDYDFCLGIFTYELLDAAAVGQAGDRISVAFPLVVDWESTPAAGFGPGARHLLKLDPISDHYDLEATCWVDDTDGPLEIWLATAWEALD